MKGNELRSLRKSLGYTQAEFGALVGLSRDYVGLIERGEAEIAPRTALAVKAIRPKGAGEGDPSTTDTLERMVEKALIDAGIRYVADRGGASATGLDFHLPDLGVDIEVKRFHSPRTVEQIGRSPNVILLQGERAAKLFCLALAGNAGLLQSLMPPIGAPVKTGAKR